MRPCSIKTRTMLIPAAYAAMLYINVPNACKVPNPNQGCMAYLLPRSDSLGEQE